MLFTRKPVTRISSMASQTSWKSAGIVTLAAVFVVVGLLVLKQARPSEARAIQRTPVESFNLGMKMGRHRVQLGTDTATNYRAGTLKSSVAQPDEVQLAANQAEVAALQKGQGRPLSMTADDFNGDGMSDLIVGYGSSAGGTITLRPGNVEAISPQSPEVLAGLREGIYPSPFLNDVDTFSLPESPDVVVTGDFNADGHADVAATSRLGQTLYLFTGDGQGGLSQRQDIPLNGQVTAMTKGQFNERNGVASLAIGVAGPGGASVQIYDQSGQGVLGSPEQFSLPSAATALTLARLDNDSAGDLAVAAGNELFVIHGRNQADPNSSGNAIEHHNLPYDIVGITSGNFIFDRESKPKLALLSPDGTVHFMTPGTLDLRPYTSEELAARQRQRIKIRRGEADDASLMAMEQAMLNRPDTGDAWIEVESHSIGAIPPGVSPQSLLTTTRDAGAMLDELLVLDSSSNRVQMVDNEKDLARTESVRAVDTVDLDSAPVAVLTTRLSTDGRLGTVVLQQNQAGPGLIIPFANVWNVNSNVDAVDDNPGNGVCHTAIAGNPCTLRAAMMETSYRGSSNTINLSAGTTYTLTLGGINGGPDDEFDAFGDDQTGGDLDIIDLNRVCSQLGGGNPATGCPGLSLGGTALTSVAIVGGNINTTVIAMGPLVPAATGNNAGLNHDRILDVNNFADPQFPIDVTLSNLTMQNGNAPHYLAHPFDAINFPTCPCFYNTPGGAIQYDGQDNVTGNPLGTITLTTVKITGNTASGQGGGVFALDDTLLVQTNSLITLNTSTLGAGGGISYGGGNKLGTQTLTISNSTIGGAGAANNAPDTTAGNGAGLSSVGGSAATITSSTISNNIAGNQGGGLAFVTTPSIAISGSTIGNNTAKTNGGGIYSSARVPGAGPTGNNPSTISVTSTNVTSNTADSDNNGTGNGGGIYNLFGTLTVQTTSHIDSNAAINGGGIYTTWTANTNDNPASLNVTTSSTVGQTGSGNTAKNNGGGIGIDAETNSGTTPKQGTVTLTSVTVQGNTANSDNTGGGEGGGIYDDGNNANFIINLALNGATIDNNVGNAGGGGGTGSGIFLQSGPMTGSSTVSINSGNDLSMAGGTFTSTSGTLNLTGDFLNSGGTFTHNSGTVICNGSSAQTIGGTTAMTFNNLQINNASGVNLGNNETVSGTLTLTNGVLGVGTNTLTLNGPVSFVGGSGSISSSATGTVSYNQGVANQVVAPGTYGNLTFNAQSKVLPNGFTVGIAGTFTTGGVAATITGNTVDFNGTGAQTVPAFNFNNLTISGARTTNSVTLINGGTIGVAGIFSPSASFTSGNYIVTNNTMDFNGTGAQTVPAFNYNNLTVSGARTTNNVTLINGGTIGVAGAFSPTASFSSGAFVIAGNTVDFNGTGAQTIPGFNFNNLTISGAHTTNSVTLVNGNIIGVAGIFSPTATFSSGNFIVTNNTVFFNGAGTQTVPQFNFNNLTISNTHGANAVTLINGGTIGIAGTFTPGSNTFVITNNTVNFNGAGTQTVPQFNFNNLTVSNTHGANAVTLVNGGTIGVAGTFTPGTSTFTILNNTMDFNGTGAQSVAAFNYHNLTISGDRGGAAITLASGNIGVGSTFNPSATNNTWVNTGNTIIFNGSATQTVPAFDFFGGLTLSNTAGANLGGNVIVNAALTLTNGTLGVGTNTLTLNGTVSATAGTLSSGTTGTVNYNQQSNGQGTVLPANYGNLTFSNFNKTLAGAGTIGIAGVFTPGTGATHTITGSTINFNGAGAQTIPAFTYNNLTSSGGAAARTLDSVNTIKIAGAFTPGTNVYTITGSTIEYNGAALQTLPSSGFNTYNNLTINNTVGATGFAGLTVNGLLDVVKGTFTSSTTFNNVQVDNGGTLAGTNATSMDVSGNWTINTGGAFTPNGNTVNFNGSGAQTIGGTASTAGATTFNNLTIANAGSGVTLGQNETVNGVLTLTNDLNTGAFTLTQPATGTTAGASDVVGNYKRAGAPLPNSALTYGNPNNVITPAGSALTSLNVRLTKTVPTDASTGGTNTGFSTAVQRTYVITPTGTFTSATLQLHYNDADLNGNDENTMTLWRYDSVLGKWQTKGATSRDTTNPNNWVQTTGVTAFSPWTFNSTFPTAAPGSVIGQILDSGGNPVEGAGIRMSGTQNRLTVTDAQGNYRFDNVETNGFYTVTPTRANFSFSPTQRSFSLLGQTTNAAFSATLASGLVNPLDTTEYFVRQQYVDFLGREPDEAGLNFWYNNIENCGTDANCRAVKRTDTSAAFFLSIEFQQTGYLVYRTYQAAYGDLPGAPVPVTLGEFKPDSAEISNGVVVNQGDWQTTLNNNQQAFMAEFVQRPRFTAAYPTTLSPTAFVDQLFTNAGVPGANGDRAAAIAEFGAASNTSDAAARGRALRIVAGNATLSQQEFNQAFVLMEYFGYLRRDANSSPDADFTGYNFWLNKLNTFNGNFNDADMVKSFVVSGEYRGRFPR